MATNSLVELMDIAKLIHAMSAKKFIPSKTLVELIANRDKRTLQRRLNKIRDEYQFIYLLNRKKEGFKVISRNYIQTIIEESNIDRKLLHFKVDIYSTEFSKIVDILNTAISRHGWIELKNYKSVSDERGADFNVVPIKLVISKDPFIQAYELNSQKIKTFFVGRAGNIKKMIIEPKQNIKIPPTAKQDDFGWIIDNLEKLRTVNLYLTNYSLNMVLRDFPNLIQKIKCLDAEEQIIEPDGLKQKVYLYKATIQYVSIKAIGRLVTGMLNHIKVEGPASVKKEFRDFAQKTVLEAMGNIL